MSKIFLGHRTAIVQAAITRPNNATPYTVGDVLGDVGATEDLLHFVGAATSQGGAGMISSACLIDDANQPTPPALELWLFSAPPAIQADNSPFAVTDPEMLAFVGVIPLTVARVGNVGAAAAGNLIIQSDTATLAFVCAGGSMDLYGKLIARNAYVPVANEVMTVRLSILQDFGDDE